MTTPGEVSPLVLQFCRRIEPDAEPLYVPVAPLGGVPTNFCNLVVTAKVARDGGEALSGWTIWLNPDVMIEAEAHMVWRSPTGDLIDVTPKPDPHSVLTRVSAALIRPQHPQQASSPG